jgi:hypothetical protein
LIDAEIDVLFLRGNSAIRYIDLCMLKVGQAVRHERWLVRVVLVGVCASGDLSRSGRRRYWVTFAPWPHGSRPILAPTSLGKIRPTGWAETSPIMLSRNGLAAIMRMPIGLAVDAQAMLPLATCAATDSCDKPWTTVAAGSFAGASPDRPWKPADPSGSAHRHDRQLCP